jgi:hypothetical protein
VAAQGVDTRVKRAILNPIKKTMNRLIAIMLALISCGCVSTRETSEQAGKQLFRFEKDGRFGFKDGAGHVVIQAVWDDAAEFACGLCPVNQGAALDYTYAPARRHGGKWGYIDTLGRVAIPITLDWATAFTEGLAQVSDAQGRRFIDTQGRTVIMVDAACHAGRLSEGLIPIYRDCSAKQMDWQTNFINSKGETLFLVDGYAAEFREGMAVLAVRKRLGATEPMYGYINQTGKIVIVPQFAEAFDFHEGLAGVRTTKTTGCYGKGDSWGYIDKTGKYVLEPKYNEVHPFRSGVARVHVGGKLREVAIHAPPVWEGGEWQLINRTGEILKRNNEWVDYPEAVNSPASK